VKTNEQPFNEHVLHTVKIYGEKILLGGSQGLIAIGTVGKSTGLQLEMGKKVLYCTIAHSQSQLALKKPSLSRSSSSSPPVVIAAVSSQEKVSTNTTPTNMTMAVSGHSLQSTIRFLAWEETSNLFVAADDQRVLTFWQLDLHSSISPLIAACVSPLTATNANSTSTSNANASTANGTTNTNTNTNMRSTNRGYHYTTKPDFQSLFHLSSTDPHQLYEQERILAVHFLSEHSGKLLVTTTKRLLILLVTYQSHQSDNSNDNSNQRHQQNNHSTSTHHIHSDEQGNLTLLSPYDIVTTCSFNVSAYVELDAVENPSEDLGMFGLQLVDSSNTTSTTNTTSTANTANTANISNISSASHRSAGVSAGVSGRVSGVNGMHSGVDSMTKIIQWRFLSKMAAISASTGAVAGATESSNIRSGHVDHHQQHTQHTQHTQPAAQHTVAAETISSVCEVGRFEVDRQQFYELIKHATPINN
jgi:hypothetical protein